MKETISDYNANSKLNCLSTYGATKTSAQNDAVNDLPKIDKDWQSNFEKLSDEGELRKELNALQDVLIEKRYKK